MTGRIFNFSLGRKVAIAGALVGAAGAILTSTAQAAPDSDWDRLANCESGGNWGTNTGNGFKGGLQFTESTWNAFGGQNFAPSADQASREQQIAVAEDVLAAQGWNAWPTCSNQLGLNSSPTDRLPQLTDITLPTTPKVADQASEAKTARATADLATSVTQEAAPELTGPVIEASQQVADVAADNDMLDELAGLIAKLRPLVRQALAELLN